MHASLGSPESTSQTASNGILIASAVMHSLLYNGLPLSAQNCYFALGIWTPIGPFNTCILEPTYVDLQPKRHLDSFSRFAGLTIVTDHVGLCPSLTMGRIF